MKKKLLASLMTVVITAGALCGSVGAVHPNKDEPSMPCDNTGTIWSHLSAQNAEPRGSHILTDKRTCYIYMRNYPHQFYCSSCKAPLYAIVTGCTTYHSSCPDGSVYHNF